MCNKHNKKAADATLDAISDKKANVTANATADTAAFTTSDTQPNTNPEIGSQITRWRKLRAWSQRELARRAGIANGALSQVELGHSSPSVATLQKVAKAFGVSLQALMFNEPAMPFEHLALGDAQLLPVLNAPEFDHLNDFTALSRGPAVTHRAIQPAAPNHNKPSLYYAFDAGGIFYGHLAKSQILSAEQLIHKAQYTLESAKMHHCLIFIEAGCGQLNIVNTHCALTQGDALKINASTSFELHASQEGLTFVAVVV